MSKTNCLWAFVTTITVGTEVSLLSPRLNYKWNSRDNTDIIRLSVGNGYRVANVFTEDHAALSGGREVVFQEELRPETSWNANLNYVKKIVTRSSTFIDIDASLFYTHFQNRIIADYDTDPNLILYNNLDGYAIARGFSTNMDISLLSGFKALAGFTFQDVFAVEEGERLDQLLTESFSGVWSLGYTFPTSRVKLDYTGNLYGPMRLPLLGDLNPGEQNRHGGVSKTFRLLYQLSAQRNYLEALRIF